MDNDFPRMLYRAGGVEKIHDGLFSTLIVGDAQAQADALADGWHLTTPEAVAALSTVPAAESFAPPTRAELEQKAASLGLKFDGRTSDKKLMGLIAEALEP